MRKTTLLALFLLTLALFLVVDGCDYGGTGNSALVPTPEDPGAMVQAMLDASERVNTFSCSFDAQVQLDLDPTTMLPEDQMLLGMFQGPVTMSGDIKVDGRTEAAAVDLTFGFAGISYNMEVRALGDQAWLSMLGQWYELSSAIEESGDEATPPEELDEEAIKSAMADLGIDPVDWLGDITLVGEESLDEIPVFHLTSEPDLRLFLNDLFVLLRDDDFLQAIDPSGELSESVADELLSDPDLREMRTELPRMLDEASVDIWVGKDDSLPRRVDCRLSLGPPPGESSDGVDSVALRVELIFDGYDMPVEVEAPENALPFSQFMEMFGSDFPEPLEDFLDDPVRS